MKFSIFDLLHWPFFEEKCAGPKQAEVYRNHLNQWVYAEELGFDAVWLTEHHFADYSMLPSPNLMLAALAERTERIRIGAMINAVPFHDPIRLAEECAMLDIISGGRLNMGFGRSADYQEYVKYEMEMAEARPRFREGLDLMIEAWTKDEIHFEGQFYKLKGASLRPRPVQQPHPPIFCPVSGEETTAWAAERGYSISSILRPAAQMAENNRYYREQGKKFGRELTGENYLVCRHVYVAESKEQAIEDIKEPMLHFFRLFRDAAVPPREEILDNFPENFKNHSIFFRRFFGDFYSVEELVESGNVIAGSPEDVANEIQRQREEIGSEHLMCIMNFGNLTHEQTIRSMELLAREVMPRFSIK